MTATKVKAPPKPWRSGWCGLGNPPASHEHCLGGAGDVPCVCSCHVVALEPDPEPARATLADVAAELAARMAAQMDRFDAQEDADFEDLVERVARRHAADAFARHGQWDDLRPAYHATARKSARRMVDLVTAELRTWEA